MTELVCSDASRYETNVMLGQQPVQYSDRLTDQNFRVYEAQAKLLSQTLTFGG